MSAIQCVECGRFIPYADMDTEKAHFRYVPDSDYSVEVCEWTCRQCVENQVPQ